ncbi:hypothetical protein [Sphingobacterium sp. LZ9M9]|nr:hypothetical protein [Sphingobacterium sp. LZ9M9]
MRLEIKTVQLKTNKMHFKAWNNSPDQYITLASVKTKRTDLHSYLRSKP